MMLPASETAGARGATRNVAVIDIGKTNAKLALVDVGTLREVAVRKCPNPVRDGGPYPHHDVEMLWAFILEGLRELGRLHPVDAISVTAHGATAALIGQGGLALPVLDYEHDGPQSCRADYDAVRPSFAETGSPPLPNGLNVGAQLFWQQRAFPAHFAAATAILMYPQYWTWRLTGVAAGEVTSLGCHTDLWSPQRRGYSSLVERMGWSGLMPAIRYAGDTLGPVLPEIAARTGLDPATPVLCGIHDSNASLVPHLMMRQPPFTVVSTGTWVISLAVGGSGRALDPARDTLINVNALGDPVPSARFMGGREFATITQGVEEGWSEADIAAVLGEGIMLLPSVESGTGPFPGRACEWRAPRPVGPEERQVAASFYLAMMTATCLDIIGAAGPAIVEGPFARNVLFVSMLAAATGRGVSADAAAMTGTSVGAALMATTSIPSPEPGSRHVAIEPAWAAYAGRWRACVDGTAARSD